MPFLSIPNELILLIAENLQRTKDVSSFLRTNRRLSSLLTPHLHDLAGQSKHGIGALHWATLRGHKELIKLLATKKGFDINALDNLSGQPALFHAMNSRTSPSMRRLLLDLGADVSIRTRDGRQIIHQAANIGCEEETMKLLLEKGACINSLDGRGQTVLYRAACMCSPSMVDFLLRNGADVNMPNQDGTTALHGAVGAGSQRRSVEVIGILLRNGADVSLRSNSGKTAYDHAVYMGFYKLVELLEPTSGSGKGI